MSTSIIEPGTRLAGRYRLEERVSVSNGSTLWKAIDEILARPVSVRTFAPDFTRTAEVVTAARSASRLNDPRLTQVFDADDSGELAYVVSEWVNGETLEQMIARRGPLEPGRAAALLGEAAEAIAAAHLAGLAHLCLTPRSLYWTTGSTVKILGLGVDAALREVDRSQAALADTRGLACLLYAALTGYWAGVGLCDLPEAPEKDGEVPAPGRLRPGVPQALDMIVCGALGLQGVARMTSPGQLAEALSQVPRVPLPLFSGPAQNPPPSMISRPAAHQAPPVRPVPPPPPPDRTRALPSRADDYDDEPRNKKPLFIAAGCIAALVVVIGGWQLSQGSAPAKGANPNIIKTGASATPAATDTTLKIVSATAVEEAYPGHHDTTIGKSPGNVFDGDTSTSWMSQRYTSPNFGLFEKGLGIQLDMGRPVSVDHVVVTIPGAGGATLSLRIGTSTLLSSLRTINHVTPATGTVTLRGRNDVRGQYLLLWFTKPPAGFKAEINEIAVYGTSG
ncbi:MAG TPA: protein kinase family protein [Streptosporangiaceae bacterium]|nr:protein kinase family protein [Streptosporangiaceae bacterium]